MEKDNIRTDAARAKGSMTVRLKVNGVEHDLDVEDDAPLLWVIRDEIGLTGTKFGCGIAQCGACTVHVDGVAQRSCITPVSSVQGHEITTIEALGANGLTPVQQAWIDHQVPQCGYCQSGMIMAVSALLAKNPHPTEDDLSQAITNICRCGTYPRIRAAVRALSEA
ncbi:MAG TPA: (2Fe-2S)-binding protein [Rhizomicrobium sp.]|jgi:isoquinoline 1-oxidoreductase alpha subunit